MDPQLKSVITSLLMTLAGSAATWGVAHGLVPAEDQTAAANILVTTVLVAVTAGIGWYKTRQASPAGLVQSIGNTDPKKVADAIDAAPPKAQSTLVQVVDTSKVLPSGVQK